MAMIYVLLVAHFVGDFICQSDWMALNKSKRWDALALHVSVYSGVIYGCLYLAGWYWASGLDRACCLPLWVPRFAPYVAGNFIAHFVQDAITSRINAKLWQANERHWFFVGIGADQLLHYVTLFVTASWWLK